MKGPPSLAHRPAGPGRWLVPFGTIHPSEFGLGMWILHPEVGLGMWILHPEVDLGMQVSHPEVDLGIQILHPEVDLRSLAISSNS